MRVAILGAYGAVGRRLAVEAARLGHRVTATGRDSRRLVDVQADDHVHLSVRDQTGLRALAEKHDVVVNATGVPDVAQVLATTQAGAAFMDISADPEYLLALSQLGEVSQPVLAGTGLAPGLTNLLAAGVPGDGALHIGIIAGAGERHGEAARAWLWSLAGRRVTSGGSTERVFRTARTFDVPGLGRRRLLRAGFGEENQLALHLGRPVSTWLALDPAWATSVLGLAGLVPRAGAALDGLNRPVGSLFATHDTWTVVVADATNTVAWATGRHEVAATAVIAALFIEHLRAATPGVHASHGLALLADLRAELARAGIHTATHAEHSCKGSDINDE